MSDPCIRSGDPFLLNYSPSELRIASEFLNTWLPFLSRDLCRHCTQNLSDRIHSLDSEFHHGAQTEQTGDNWNVSNSDTNNVESLDTNDHSEDNWDPNSLGSSKDGAHQCSEPRPEVSALESTAAETSTSRLSWADMAQEDELEEEEEERELNKQLVDSNALAGEIKNMKIVEKPKLSRERREYIRFMNVKRKKDFICLERINGKLVNILEGLELHLGIFSAAEQKRIVDLVMSLQEMGKKGELKGKTYSAPHKWMRGKGRVTIQFGCCYNYAMDRDGNPPGILQNVMADPIPPLFKVIIRRLIRWHVLPPTCVPDSCIVNIYSEGDCMPPHIDSHDFVRPFCTVSFLSECNIVFGSNLKIVRAGEFAGSYAIALPVGSVLVLNGNGADVAKHCVPAVHSKRISITFRKMDEAKRPIDFVPEPDLVGIQPLSYEVDRSNGSNGLKPDRQIKRRIERRGARSEARAPAEGNGVHLLLHDSPRTQQGHPNRRWGKVNRSG